MSADAFGNGLEDPWGQRPGRIRVFLVDDHEVILRGLCFLFSTRPELAVAGSAMSCTDARERVQSIQPDVVVIDVRLPDGSGLELCREISTLSPRTRVIVLTSTDDGDVRDAAIDAGAAAFVLKE